MLDKSLPSIAGCMEPTLDWKKRTGLHRDDANEHGWRTCDAVLSHCSLGVLERVGDGQ